jgi:hypothetical protein
MESVQISTLTRPSVSETGLHLSDKRKPRGSQFRRVIYARAAGTKPNISHRMIQRAGLRSRAGRRRPRYFQRLGVTKHDRGQIVQVQAMACQRVPHIEGSGKHFALVRAAQHAN